MSFSFGCDSGSPCSSRSQTVQEMPCPSGSPPSGGCENGSEPKDTVFKRVLHASLTPSSKNLRYSTSFVACVPLGKAYKTQTS